MNRIYAAVIHKDESSDFGVSFPDFPGCVSCGRSLEEAIELAKEALQFHIEGMVEDDSPIPEPTPLQNFAQSKAAKAALAVVLIEARLPGKSKRVNITLEENLLGDIDRAARKRGMNRSAFLAEGARRLILS